VELPLAVGAGAGLGGADFGASMAGGEEVATGVSRGAGELAPASGEGAFRGFTLLIRMTPWESTDFSMDAAKAGLLHKTSPARTIPKIRPRLMGKKCSRQPSVDFSVFSLLQGA